MFGLSKPYVVSVYSTSDFTSETIYLHLTMLWHFPWIAPIQLSSFACVVRLRNLKHKSVVELSCLAEQ